MTNDRDETPQAGEVPFAQENFKFLIGIDDDNGVVRMRAAVPHAVAGSTLDLSDPAVFLGWWIQEHWNDLTNMAAGEYNVRQALVAATAPPALKLVAPDGGLLQ